VSRGGHGGVGHPQVLDGNAGFLGAASVAGNELHADMVEMILDRAAERDHGEQRVLRAAFAEEQLQGLAANQRTGEHQTGAPGRKVANHPGFKAQVVIEIGEDFDAARDEDVIAAFLA
jgi:hypothetical protein